MSTDAAYARNQPVRGNVLTGMERILDKPRCSVYRTAALNIAINTAQSVVWDTLDYQTEGMWNTTNLIYARTAGLYDCKAWVNWAANAAGYRQMYFVKTSAIIYSSSLVNAVAAGLPTIQSIASHIPLNADDYVEVIAIQNAVNPLALNVSTAGDRESGFQCCLISTTN